MSLYLNFKDFSISSEAKSDRTCIVSAHQLGEICTPAQLNRFAEKVIGERFKRGTPLKKGADSLFAAMKKAVGDKVPAQGQDDDKPEPATTKKEAAMKKAVGDKVPAQGQGDDKPEPATTKKGAAMKPPAKDAAKPKPKKVGYDKAAAAIQAEYTEVVEALAIVGKFVNRSQVMTKVREERDQKLKALGNIKRFL